MAVLTEKQKHEIAARGVGPLDFRADVSSVNVETRTADLVWSTGAKVRRMTWDGPVDEELSMDPKCVRMGRLQSGTAPLLRDHSGYTENVIGVVTSARIENGKGYASVRFARAEDDPSADAIFRKICDKIIRNISVGYRTWRSEKIAPVLAADVPTLRAVDWEPYEISVVGMGADADAGFRDLSFTVAQPSPEEGHKMDPEEVKKLEAERAAKLALEAEQVAKRAAELKDVAEKSARNERDRVSGIQAAVRAAHLDSKFGEKLIADGTPVDQCRDLVIKAMMAREEKDGSTFAPNDASIQVGKTEKEKFAIGATARLLMVGSMSSQAINQARSLVDSLTREGKTIPEPLLRLGKIETDPGEFRGASVSDLARRCLELDGVSTKGMTKNELAARAFSHRSVGMASTSDFPILLENVMYKTLLAAYATTPDTWSRFAKTDTVVDFRAANRYRSSSLGDLEEINEHGEFHSMSIPDGEKATISTATKGGIIAVTRQLIINDDMGALTDLATKLGRSARRGIEKDVYALLALNGGLGPTMSDGHPLFDAAHGNIGTGSALTVAGLDADRVLFLSQKDVGGNDYLDLGPSVLMVPVGLGAAARVINSSAYDPTTGTATLQRPNSVQGLFKDIIDTPRITGTRRYIFADPSIAPALTVVFLEGSGQGPELFTKIGWHVDGTELKVRIDYKAQALDHRGAVTNAGT